MTQQVVVFFYGTGTPRISNADFQIFGNAFLALGDHSIEDVAFFAYGGSDSEGKFWALGGLNANGTGEIAKKFVQELSTIYSEYPREKIKVNMVAHSRGGISAFKAVKKIQADPILSQYAEVVLDVRDPVPGNLEITVKMRIPSTVSAKVSNLESCNVVKKAYITLAEQVSNDRLGNYTPGFNAIIPNFSPETITEVEVLPMCHNEQLYAYCDEDEDEDEDKSKKYSRLIMSLVYEKSIQLILEHGAHSDASRNNEIKKSKEKQCALYGEIKDHHAKPTIGLRSDETPRGIHFGARIVREKSECSYLNSRHQKLARDIGEPEKKPSLLLRVDPAPSNISYKQMFDLMSFDSNMSSENLNYLDNRRAIEKLVEQINKQTDLIDKQSEQGERFSRSAQKLKQTLLAEVAKKTDTVRKKGSAFNVESEYAYQCLNKLKTTLEKVNSKQNASEKLEALKEFENNSKKSSSGWAKFGKYLTGFLVLATATVVGAVVGAGICAAATSWTGPGAIVGAIVGGYAGAKITAAATAGGAVGLLGAIGFFGKKNKMKKDNSEFVKSGQSLLSSSVHVTMSIQNNQDGRYLNPTFRVKLQT